MRRGINLFYVDEKLGHLSAKTIIDGSLVSKDPYSCIVVTKLGSVTSIVTSAGSRLGGNLDLQIVF